VTSSGRRARLAGLGVVACAIGMAAGVGASRVLFVGAGLLGCAIVFWAWRRTSPPARTVLVVALLARAVVFPLPPSLSDDGYRYLWDGYLTIAGVNPYAFVPSDPRLAGVAPEELLAEMNSPRYHSVYPPAAQAVFAVAAAASGGDWRAGWYVLKLLLVLIEGAGILLLVRMVGPGLALLYAWHPLAIMEVAGQGHLEGGLVGPLVLALAALGRGRPISAGAALAVGGWFKLWPFLLLPFTRSQRLGVLAAGAVVAALLALPFMAPYVLPNVGESLLLYSQHFEWNAAPYFLLKTAAWAVAGESLGPHVGGILQAFFLLSLPAVLLITRRRGWTTAQSWLAVAGLFIVTATTVHPWYLLGILVLLPLAAPASRGWTWHVGAWHALAAGSLATYLFYTHGDVSYLAAVWAGWGAWGALMGVAAVVALLPALMRRRGEDKWAWINNHVPAGARILDVGAGEGFVGEAASREGHQVTLADVIDFNRTDLPLLPVRDSRIPVASGGVDVAIVVFVLHHAEDPLALLKEVRRVTTGRVIVIESVAETAWDRWWLPGADRFFNRLRSDGAMRDQEGYLHFRSASGWRTMFGEAGLVSIAEEGRGGVFHRKRLFVLEPAGGTRTR
jgi:SAM-dependent methyltransferase